MIKAEADIDSIVLDAVEPNVEYRPTELMKAVKRQRSVNESVLLEAIWRLISEGKLELLSDRKLRLPRRRR
ncbi:MAG TPA: hypothetical protein VFI95_16425 [Terriglobales bacterium]|nr:hypothetical protein [Terriglobales bacterium]